MFRVGIEQSKEFIRRIKNENYIKTNNSNLYLFEFKKPKIKIIIVNERTLVNT